MPQQSISSIPLSVLRLEDQRCGGSLGGARKIGNASLHFTATKVVSELIGDLQQTVAFHDSDDGREDLDGGDAKERLCNCAEEVDQARQLDPSTRVFQTTEVPGHPGDWIITCHPYQTS